jgi:hypothetical protein
LYQEQLIASTWTRTNGNSPFFAGAQGIIIIVSF